MDKNYYLDLAKSMDKYSGEQRQSLVSGYVYDTFDNDAVTKMPAVFFAELLERESDPICKWYEIKAIGELRATEYMDLLFSILLKENVTFNTGTSLHLIVAVSLGKMGEVVIPEVVKLFDFGNESTRLAVIDTLGETKCSLAAETLMEMISKFNLKEFNYAMLAISKCGDKGQTILKKIYHKCNDEKQLICVIDALCYSTANSDIIKEALYSNTVCVINLFLAKTRGACIMLDQIKRVQNPWTQEDKRFIKMKGVSFDE